MGDGGWGLTVVYSPMGSGQSVEFGLLEAPSSSSTFLGSSWIGTLNPHLFSLDQQSTSGTQPPPVCSTVYPYWLVNPLYGTRLRSIQTVYTRMFFCQMSNGCNWFS